VNKQLQKVRTSSLVIVIAMIVGSSVAPLRAEELSRKTIAAHQAYAIYYAYGQWTATKAGVSMADLVDYQVAIEESVNAYVVQFLHLSQRRSADLGATYRVDKQTNAVRALQVGEIDLIDAESVALSGAEAAVIVSSVATRNSLPVERRPALSPDATALIVFETDYEYLSFVDWAVLNRIREERIVVLGCAAEELYRVNRSTFMATRMPDCFH
jgi:hypothetical protein